MTNSIDQLYDFRIKAFREKENLKRSLFGILDSVYAPFIKEENVVLVVGFHRSGTTYLMEALSALIGGRRSFEPLSDCMPEARRFLHPYVFRNYDGNDKQMGFPYRRTNETDPNLEVFLKKALQGSLSHYRVWHRSRSLSNYMKLRMTVKLVWGNLLAAWLANAFCSKMIFLYRHPLGVVESILRQKWGLLFQHEAFLSLFFDQEKLVNDWLEPFQEDIEKNSNDPISRIALGYAINHFIPFSQARNGDFSPLFVKYEDMVMRPTETFDRIGSFLGLSFQPQLVDQLASRTSSSTQTSRMNVTPYQRCFSWKGNLDKDTIHKVMNILEKYDVDNLSYT